MPAEVDHVLSLGHRVASKVDLANRTGHTGIGRGAEDRERWETEAEGCIDGTGGTEDWLNGGEEGGGGEGGSVGAGKSRRRIERTEDERKRDGRRRGGMRGGGRRQRMEAVVEGDRRV
jgi:hypothetical protein